MGKGNMPGVGDKKVIRKVPMWFQGGDHKSEVRNMKTDNYKESSNTVMENSKRCLDSDMLGVI